jgi:hypothetical protein
MDEWLSDLIAKIDCNRKLLFRLGPGLPAALGELGQAIKNDIETLEKAFPD